jgi:hypothetical protein
LPTLLLVGKPDCHLCHVLLETAAPVAHELGLALEQKDLRDDPELERRYLFEIPVLLLEGVEVARIRATADELRARLGRLLAER